MVALEELMAFLNDFMGDAGNQDPHMPNGLQVRGHPQVRKLATGVSASLRLFEMAVEREADVLLVHHGLSMPAGMLFDGVFTGRVRYLLQHALSLIGYHFLLDSHPQVGHNAQILCRLGAEPVAPYGLPGEPAWGWLGEFATPVSLEEICSGCERLFGQKGVQYLFGPQEVRRVVAISGKGAPYPSGMESLIQKEVDLFITGETSEWVRELFREVGISFIAGGHYNTEKIGILALGEVIAGHFPTLSVEFVDLPNPV
ncbi:MAG: Nif3-like dinuclear metal center hexameric protein [Chloroflexota bacterium]|nr:Nif3-like dinuclear metal center hexameric protein [Chloroflexota bacterium]